MNYKEKAADEYEQLLKNKSDIFLMKLLKILIN